MSASITPLYTMNVAAGEALMSQMALQYKTMQAAKITTDKKFDQWNQFVEKAAEPAPQQGTDLMATSLFGFLLDCLFGMGMFSGVSTGIAETVQGVAHIGVMEHASRGNMQHAANINEELSKRAFLNSQQNQSQQVKALQQMIAMMLMNYMGNQSEDGKETTGGSTGQAMKKAEQVVSSVWGQGAKDMFVKNRKDMVCLKVFFNREVNEMTLPKRQAFYTPQVA